MPDRYYLIKINTNSQGQDASTVSMFDTLEKAQVAYHQTLAMFHNAPDVLYAIVQIIHILKMGYVNLNVIKDMNL